MTRLTENRGSLAAGPQHSGVAWDIELSSAVSVAEPHGPKYEQLRRRIIRQIMAGEFQPGDALPTERWWAEHHRVARSTVRQAMMSLERDGLIRRIQGKGTFLHDQVLRAKGAGSSLFGSGVADSGQAGLSAFALVVPETQAGFYPSLQRSFDEAAADVHHQLLVCNTGNSLDRQGNIILQLMDKRVAGVALVPVTLPSTPAYQLTQLQKAGIPVVCCHRRVEGVSTPLVSIPYRELGHLAARSLLERGHRRIAFFAPQRTATAMLYGDGLRAGLAEGQAQIPEACEFYGPDALINPAEYESEIALALRGMLSLPERPTAIFASFDSLAELIFLLLGRMGVAVPQDISIVGLGGVSRTTPIMRQLTSVTIDEVQAGCLAVDLLEQMNRGELSLHDDSVHRVRTGLSLGQSLGVYSGV